MSDASPLDQAIQDLSDAAAQASIVDYDWEAPWRFVQAERARLDALAKAAAVRIAADLGPFMGRPVAVVAEPVTEHYGRALAMPDAGPRVAVPVTDAAGARCGMAAMPAEAAIGWVEVLLGGKPGAAEVRPMSALESALAGDVAAVIVKAFAAALKQAGGPALTHKDEVMTDGSPLEGLEAEAFVRMTFTATLDDAPVALTVALTADSVAAAAGAAGGAGGASARKNAGHRERIAQHLMRTPVTAKVHVGHAVALLGDVNALEPGDVLLLDRCASDTADLLVNGNLLVRGHVAQRDGRYAFRVANLRKFPRLPLQRKD
jgi:flagellar motor switch protein FliN/FliY